MIPDTHSSGGWLVCNWCGYHVWGSKPGRSLMSDHMGGHRRYRRADVLAVLNGDPR